MARAQITEIYSNVTPEIRAYILENPDIIFEAAVVRREAEEESKRDVI